MSGTDQRDERLRDQWAAAADPESPGEGCPADSEIWSAARGELPPERVTALLAHAEGCSLCAASFQAAAALSREAEGAAPRTAGAHQPAGRVAPFRPARRHVVTVLLAAAATIVLMFLLPRLVNENATIDRVEPAFAIEAGLWKEGEGGGVPLSDGQRIRPGDRLYLTVHGERPSYVYVISRDLEGSASVLFPVAGAQWTNPLPSGKAVRLPGETSSEYDSWEVSSAGGRETFTVLASAEPLEELESALALMEQATPDTYVRGGGDEPSDPEAGARAAEALDAALAAVQSGKDESLYAREIILENPR